MVNAMYIYHATKKNEGDGSVLHMPEGRKIMVRESLNDIFPAYEYGKDFFYEKTTDPEINPMRAIGRGAEERIRNKAGDA